MLGLVGGDHWSKAPEPEMDAGVRTKIVWDSALPTLRVPSKRKEVVNEETILGGDHWGKAREPEPDARERTEIRLELRTVDVKGLRQNAPLEQSS